MTFGVALAMGLTSPRWVSSGFYRVHLWVLMGLNTLAALSIYTQRESLSSSFASVSLALFLSVGMAMGAYLGAVLWLVEKVSAGRFVLGAIVIAGLAATIAATAWPGQISPAWCSLMLLDMASSGLLLGVALAAMFLGHWHLNVPTMDLRPLKRLVKVMGGAIVARALVNGTGLVLLTLAAAPSSTAFWIFVGLRWLAGLVGTMVLAWMTWYTLKVPNTQSATGILYASVILAFIGELMSQFLSAESHYPL